MEVCMHEPLDDYLRRSREAINQNDFELAKDNLLKAIDLDPKSAQVMNLVGVMLEMRAEFARGGRCHGAVFKTSIPKKWWIFKLFNFGVYMKH